nr:MAG TPA: hypothetical protein [Caudoviricetes sp.]
MVFLLTFSVSASSSCVIPLFTLAAFKVMVILHFHLAL